MAEEEKIPKYEKMGKVYEDEDGTLFHGWEKSTKTRCFLQLLKNRKQEDAWEKSFISSLRALSLDQNKYFVPKAVAVLEDKKKYIVYDVPSGINKPAVVGLFQQIPPSMESFFHKILAVGKELASILSGLHEKSCAHGNLTLQSVLFIKNEGSQDAHLMLKIDQTADLTKQGEDFSSLVNLIMQALQKVEHSIPECLQTKWKSLENKLKSCQTVPELTQWLSDILKEESDHKDKEFIKEMETWIQNTRYLFSRKNLFAEIKMDKACAVQFSPMTLLKFQILLYPPHSPHFLPTDILKRWQEVYISLCRDILRLSNDVEMQDAIKKIQEMIEQKINERKITDPRLKENIQKSISCNLDTMKKKIESFIVSCCAWFQDCNYCKMFLDSIQMVKKEGVVLRNIMVWLPLIEKDEMQEPVFVNPDSDDLTLRGCIDPYYFLYNMLEAQAYAYLYVHLIMGNPSGKSVLWFCKVAAKEISMQIVRKAAEIVRLKTPEIKDTSIYAAFLQHHKGIWEMAKTLVNQKKNPTGQQKIQDIMTDRHVDIADLTQEGFFSNVRVSDHKANVAITPAASMKYLFLKTIFTEQLNVPATGEIDKEEFKTIIRNSRKELEILNSDGLKRQILEIPDNTSVKDFVIELFKIIDQRMAKVRGTLMVKSTLDSLHKLIESIFQDVNEDEARRFAIRIGKIWNNPNFYPILVKTVQFYESQGIPFCDVAGIILRSTKWLYSPEFTTIFISNTCQNEHTFWQGILEAQAYAFLWQRFLTNMKPIPQDVEYFVKASASEISLYAILQASMAENILPEIDVERWQVQLVEKIHQEVKDNLFLWKSMMKILPELQKPGHRLQCDFSFFQDHFTKLGWGTLYNTYLFGDYCLQWMSIGQDKGCLLTHKGSIIQTLPHSGDSF